MSNFLPMFCGAAIFLVVAPALFFALLVRYTPLFGIARSHRIIRLSIIVIGGIMTFVIVFELTLLSQKPLRLWITSCREGSDYRLTDNAILLDS